MTLKIGIPRALYYHKFYPTWHTFFTELGAEVVLSQLSDKNILKQGSDATVDEFCLPIKVFLGMSTPFKKVRPSLYPKAHKHRK